MRDEGDSARMRGPRGGARLAAQRECSRREFLLGSAAGLASLLLGCHGAGTRRSTGPNLLLIVVDTLRADHVGALGCPLPASPCIDQLVRRSVVFERAVSCAPLTGAAHASLMTGTYQTRHGVTGNHGAISDRVPTLAETLKEQGYETAAIVSNPVLTPGNLAGIERGFRDYNTEFPSVELNRQSTYRDARDTTARAVQWLGRRHRRPFFLWVHYQEPHGPYEVPDRELLTRIGSPIRLPGEPPSLPVLPGQFGQGGIPQYQVLGRVRDPSVYRAHYAARAAYADRFVGELVDHVSKSELDANTVIALTSDHGELLGEHGYYFQHGITALWPVLHVPLLVGGPGIPAGRRITAAVGTVDIAPTLLDLLGISPSAAGSEPDGRSLKPWIQGQTPAEDIPRFAMCERSLEVCAVVGCHKYTVSVRAGQGSESLTDTDSDPREDHNLLSKEAEMASMLRQRLDPFIGDATSALTAGRSPMPSLSPEDRRRMKALGYL